MRTRSSTVRRTANRDLDRCARRKTWLQLVFTKESPRERQIGSTGAASRSDISLFSSSSILEQIFPSGSCFVHQSSLGTPLASWCTLWSPESSRLFACSLPDPLSRRVITPGLKWTKLDLRNLRSIKWSVQYRPETLLSRHLFYTPSWLHNPGS